MAHAARWLRAIGIACLGPAVAGATVWGALAVYYSDLATAPLRLGLAAAFALGTLCAFLFLPNRRRTLLVFGAAFAALLLWWLDRALEPAQLAARGCAAALCHPGRRARDPA
jgi:hypothetical protein